MTKNTKDKRFFLKTYAVVALFAVATAASAQAGEKAICEVVKGKYNNSMLAVHEDVTLESNGTYSFDLAALDKLTLNVSGRDETFTIKALTVTGGPHSGTKLDLVLDSHPDKVTAVLLVNKSPGRIRQRFKALLVISGVNINLSTGEGIPVFSERSLVYNLKCKAE